MIGISVLLGVELFNFVSLNVRTWTCFAKALRLQQGVHAVFILVVNNFLQGGIHILIVSSPVSLASNLFQSKLMISIPRGVFCLIHKNLSCTLEVIKEIPLQSLDAHLFVVA